MATIVRPEKRALKGQHSPSRKRARRDSNSNETVPFNWEEQSVSVPDSLKYASQTHEFSTGAIISMRLKNFQVATDSTFHFKPYLNVVLGSNGSGKSTIVNAIFLLFRGKLRDLDRTNYDEFIQFGQQHAVVSALVQGDDSSIRNQVISLLIERHQRRPGAAVPKPRWYLNGHEQTEAYIDRFIAALHIQVNNLCQFLPQFRVAAFSGESSQQRLVSTENAIGYEGMVADHQLLCATGIEQADLKRNIDLLREQTIQLTEKQETLEQKREKLELANRDRKRADMLGQVIKISRYMAVQKELSKIEEEVKTAEHNIHQFDSDNQEKYDFITSERRKAERLQAEAVELSENLDTSKKLFNEHVNSVRLQQGLIADCLRAISTLEAEIRSGAARIEKLSKEEDEAKVLIGRARKRLNDMGSDTAKFESQQQEFSTLEQQYRELQTNLESDSVKRGQLASKIKLKRLELEANEKTLADLESSTGTATRSPSSLGGNSYSTESLRRSVEFVKRHQSKFEKPIIMPALLSLHITDQRVTPAFVEAISYVQLQKFVCQTRGDQKLLTELASKSDDIDIKTTFVQPGRALKGYDDRKLEDLKNMGFDGIISDKLDGPEPMLMFMNSLGMNKIPYSSSEISNQARAKLTEGEFANVEFADKAAYYRIRRSFYGAKLRTETSKALSSATPHWATLMLRKDTSEEQTRCRQNILACTESVKALKSELAQQDLKITEAQNHIDAMKVNLRDLKSKFIDEKKLRSDLERTTNTERQLKRKLKELRDYESSRYTNLSTHTQKLDSELAVLNKLTLDTPGALIKELQSAQYTLAKRRSQAADAQNQVQLLAQALRRERESLEHELERKRDTMNRLHSEHRGMHEGFEQATSWLRSNRQLKEGTKLAKQTPLSELENELVTLNAAVDLHNQRADNLPSVLQQLERVETQLSEDRRRLETSVARLSEISMTTQTVRTRWESALRQLIGRVSEKFSELFDKLGCRGNVTLNSEDEFAIGKWGVDINVAFRPGELELSRLSRFRQSGGERAVSTAVYLLALQEMAKAPFRVLDEINQGMDEKNERMTMKFFIDMACEPNSTTGRAQQYFLVTPKLISNPPCHKNMNVTFIFGGIAVGNTDKLIMPSQQELTIQSLGEEIHSENEPSEGEDN